MTITKIQKKKEAERIAKRRREELASYDQPIITVHSPKLEEELKTVAAKKSA